MNNANVMALNIQQAAPVKGTGKPGMRGSADDASALNFDEALGRLQQEAQKELTSTGKENTSQGKDTGDGGSGKDGAPQSHLAMVMALPLQQVAAEEIAAVEEAAEEAPAAVVDFTEEAPVSGDLIKPPADFAMEGKAPQQNLRSLLPQSDEAEVKNRDFLAMLSGDLTSSQKAEAQKAEAQGRQEPVAQLARAVQDFGGGKQLTERQDASVGVGQQARTVTEAPQRAFNPMMVGQPLQEAEPRDPLGLALKQAQNPTLRGEQPADKGMQLKGEIKTPAAAVQAVQVPAVNAAAVSEQGRPAAKNESLQPLLGNNIVVETEEMAQPLRVMHSQDAQQESAFRQQQGQPSSQGNLAQLVEAEEAEAPAQAVPTSHNLGAAQANAFQQAMTTAVAEAPETPEVPLQPQTDYEVPGQIVEQARLIRSGQDTEMVIHLKPEHLGDLTLKISVTENGAVTASFHSDNAQVRTIIENSLVQLRQELNDQGLKVDSVEVFSGLPDGQLPQGQGQQAWQQGSQGRYAGERKPEDYAEEADDLAAAALAQSQENAADDGVDYRV